jgi:hypothetical protein
MLDLLLYVVLPASAPLLLLSFDCTDNASILSIGTRPDPPFSCALVPPTAAWTTRPRRDEDGVGASPRRRRPVSLGVRSHLGLLVVSLESLAGRGYGATRYCTAATAVRTAALQKKRKLHLGAT